ncbi:hypothetical protein [Clostridium sp. ZBS4]|uniref:hypothetical protein n=1 Tax=Clostridium sp. ZBS4 TaxID=2949974 RepID=UPI002079D554|nr:hypothetical protein [Clostridium sp. ZBS4]
MNLNDKLSIMAAITFTVCFGLNSYFDYIIKKIQSYLLFKKSSYYKLDKIYELIYIKKYKKRDRHFISELKIKLNTYISTYKYKNKGSLDTIITIYTTSLLTIVITSYTIQSQGNPKLIDSIIKNLNNDFITIFLIIVISYSINGILKKIAEIKFEYYLMLNNIIKDIENNDPSKDNYIYINKLEC